MTILSLFRKRPRVLASLPTPESERNPFDLWPAKERWVKDQSSWNHPDVDDVVEAFVAGRPWKPPRFSMPAEIENVDGVSWHEAPIPPSGHVCVPQTTGWNNLTQIWRCACGAIAHSDDLRAPKDYPTLRYRYHEAWLERNSRRGQHR